MKQKQVFTVIYENEIFLAVNKAPGIAVSPDRWDESKERLDRLLDAYLSAADSAGKTAPKPRVYTVHRLDRDTSGLVLFAKTPEAHKELSMAFANNSLQKRYIAVIHGVPSWNETSCDLPLVPDGDKKHRTIIDKYRGKKSLTFFRLALSAGNYSILEALPKTGRTHQIRAHLAALGHPIVCDPLYGRASPKGILLSSLKKNWQGDPLDEKPLLARLGLHARELCLPPSLAGSLHITEQRFLAPLHRDLNALIKQMEKTAETAHFSGL
ncbi:MAG: RNA pseudouridine synthase [Spirochaetaceae bacterium]|jgi:RluA family pseudouridine synthase|nr:RNA pseudouridine synthase [Spirochaetaceae bacterium]